MTKSLRDQIDVGLDHVRFWLRRLCRPIYSRFVLILMAVIKLVVQTAWWFRIGFGSARNSESLKHFFTGALSLLLISSCICCLKQAIKRSNDIVHSVQFGSVGPVKRLRTLHYSSFTARFAL